MISSTCRPESSSIWLSNTTLRDGHSSRGGNGTAIVFPIRDTAELTAWILMPEGKKYQSFRIVRYPTGKPEKVEAVKVVTEYLAEEFTIIAFKLLSLDAGYCYEVSWTYR